jgi:ribonuclease HIII
VSALLTALRARLTAAHCTMTAGKPIPYGEQWLINDGTTEVVLNYWPGRGTVQVQGKPSELRSRLEQLLRELRDAQQPAAKPTPPLAAVGLPADVGAASGANGELGMDESGKGDWYGPLVIAGVVLTPAQAEQLRRAGVRDSKTVERAALPALAALIRRSLPAEQVAVLSLSPAEYNQRYQRFQNINLLLADAYAELAAPLHTRLQPQHIVCDQFSQRADRLNAAFQRRKLPRPQQLHHAENHSVAVAAASIIATTHFQAALVTLGQQAGLPAGLPAGSSAIRALQSAAEQIIRRHGPAAMADYAKLNFKPVRVLLGLPVDEPER